MMVCSAFLFFSWPDRGVFGCSWPRKKTASHPLGLVQNERAASRDSSCLAGNRLRIAATSEMNNENFIMMKMGCLKRV